MSKGKQFQETRRYLIELSQQAKLLRKLENLDMTINQILLSLIYETNGATEFNTFHQWKELGYTVLKGSKAFTIWGQPRKGNEKQEGEQKAKEGQQEDEYSFFPICYLFSDKQVYKNGKQEKEREEESELVGASNNLDDIL